MRVPLTPEPVLTLLMDTMILCQRGLITVTLMSILTNYQFKILVDWDLQQVHLTTKVE